jgi:pimeloyl-ACP methyl ester carboxylesterase
MPTARPGWPLPIRTESDVQGQIVSFLDRPGEGPPVVLLHGWGASAESFSGLFRRSRTPRRLVAVDLPGFGLSPMGRGGWTTSAYSELVRAWAESRGWPEFSLLGHSYGGSISMRLSAGAAPPVDRLLLCSASGIRPKDEMVAGSGVSRFKALRAVARRLPGPASRPAIEWLSQRYGSADYKAASPEQRPILVAAVKEDLTPLATLIEVPTLVVWGARDAELPLEPHASRLAGLIPPAELVLFAASGHFPFVDEPERFALVFDAFMDAEL